MMIGAVLIVGGSLLFGLACAGEMSKRTSATEAVMADIRALEREICGKLAPLPEAVREAGRGRNSTLLRAFAEKLEEIGSENTAESWRAAVEDAGIPAEAARLAYSLASVIGRYGRDEQREAFEETLARLDVVREELHKESRVLGKLFIAFGSCGGALLAILLI